MRVIISAVLFICLIAIPVFAGEKEEIEYELAYWQEHIKALQMDFEISQGKLKQATAKKQAFEAKQKEESKDKEKK